MPFHNPSEFLLCGRKFNALYLIFFVEYFLNMSVFVQSVSDCFLINCILALKLRLRSLDVPCLRFSFTLQMSEYLILWVFNIFSFNHHIFKEKPKVDTLWMPPWSNISTFCKIQHTQKKKRINNFCSVNILIIRLFLSYFSIIFFFFWTIPSKYLVLMNGYSNDIWTVVYAW